MPRAIDSVAVHAGREDLRDLGVHAPPLELSSTYPIQSLAEAAEDLDGLLQGGLPTHSSVYSRLSNPTVDRFERAFAQLERAEGAVAFSSGMAAITACLMAASLRGRHVVAVRPLYGGTDHLLASGLLGLDTSWVTADSVATALRPDTALIVIETPGNPTMALVDIADVVRQARGVPVMVDSTFATPVLQQPLTLGAAFSLHSATKFIGGHGDVLAGIVATTDAWARELRKVRILTGAILHPLGAYLLHRGLPTLPLRVRAAQDTAIELAKRLVSHPAIERVFFPGLPSGDALRLVGRQMRGPGSMIAFEMRDGYDAAALVMQHVRLITPAVSLGSTDSLIQHPASLTHRVVDAQARASTGIDAGLLRLSVGLEHVDDLWRDLTAAFAVTEQRRRARAQPSATVLAGAT